MALPSSGAISFNAINVELGLTGTAQISLNDGAVRTLFGVASGAISMNQGYGKSNRISVTITLASNTTDYTLDTAQIPGYVAGATDVTLVVNSGVYVYSTNTANAGLTVAALDAGDTVSIVNDGFILGMGGGQGATAGGNAVNLNRSVLITNNSYIAGGGGAGGGGNGGGGGGAGGGVGGGGAAGGGPGSSGSNGSGSGTAVGGGGGGRILPGTGGAGVSANAVGRGGGAGGGGAAYAIIISGSTWANGGGGGGGGWGASGGSGSGGASPFSGATGGAGGSSNNNGANGTSPSSTIVAGSAGGKAVNLNGNTVTWLANGTRWGAIS